MSSWSSQRIISITNRKTSRIKTFVFCFLQSFWDRSRWWYESQRLKTIFTTRPVVLTWQVNYGFVSFLFSHAMPFQCPVVFPFFNSPQRIADHRRQRQYDTGQIERHVVVTGKVFEHACETKIIFFCKKKTDLSSPAIRCGRNEQTEIQKRLNIYILVRVAPYLLQYIVSEKSTTFFFFTTQLCKGHIFSTK